MKNRYLLIAVLHLLMSACSEPAVSAAPGVVPSVTATQTAQRLTEVVILDVRTQEEFAQGHVPGAVNLDIDDPAFAAKVAELDRSQGYVVHCSANVPEGRGARALSTMASLGFSKLENLEGGYAAWVEAGAPTTR